MNFTAWLDVAIGLVLIYLGASLLVTVINEYVTQILNKRGKNLSASLQQLFDDDSIRSLLSQSPIIRNFFDPQAGKPPSYVDPQVLAHLLVGGLAAGAAAPQAVQKVADTLADLPDSSLKQQLLALVSTAGKNVETLTASVADWTNRSLTALGESYKRHLQIISFGIGLMVAASCNLDTVALTRHLYHSKEAREAAVTLAQQITQKTDKDTFDRCLAKQRDERNSDPDCTPMMGLVDVVQSRNSDLGQIPIGWPVTPASTASGVDCLISWAVRAFGWLLTAIAISLGAPFWFDLLNQLINLRHGMRKPSV